MPALYRHSVVAIYGKIGGGPAGIVRAMKIARDTLAKHGYLYHRGGNEVLEGIQLTGKGWVREQQHIREGMAGAAKDNEFESLYKAIEPKLWELDGPGGKKPPSGVQDSSDRTAEERSQPKPDGSQIVGEVYPPPRKK